MARVRGRCPCFSPAFVFCLSNGGANSFLQVSDVLCPNETELALLCQRDIDPSNDESVCAGARELIARGAYLLHTPDITYRKYSTADRFHPRCRCRARWSMMSD